MFLNKRIASAAALCILLCGGLFAQDIENQALDGDQLNGLIKTYLTNVSNLIPDSTTLQNVWSYSPKTAALWFGGGVNASFTMQDRSRMARILDGGEGFGGQNDDITQLPEGLPFLVAGAFDLRGGAKRLDVGLSGMWMSSDLPVLKNVLGENSNYIYWTAGGDVRVVIFRDGKLFDYMPALTVQAGYYFTSMTFGFASGSGDNQTEKVNIDFRNDSYMGAVQISKELPLVTPFIGGKVIISKTDSDFSWETDRPVTVSGRSYRGLLYNAKGSEGEPQLYFHAYGGLGINLLVPHLITIGCAYNVVTEHFGANISVRLVDTN